MIRRSAPRLLGAGALAMLAWSCGSSGPSKELADARKAYDEAARSPAATYRRSELSRAREDLDSAEQAHVADPGSKREKHLAREAERQADVAKNDGTYDANQHAAERLAAYQRADLAKSADEGAKEDVPEQPASKLKDTREANERNPHRRWALEGLPPEATVKQDARGVVITLRGALLFSSGSSHLTSAAARNVGRVADAIKRQPGNNYVRVEGYTDAQGGNSENQRLSEQRARAVADHLIARGIDKKRVSVVGRGDSVPVGDNGTAEGRASNRRVEIVLGTHDSAAR
jgi:flagellar motor protein MotB